MSNEGQRVKDSAQFDKNFFSNFSRKPGKQNNMVEATLYTNGCSKGSDEVNFMEQVEITVTIETQVRGMLEIYLTSPMGTTTLILPV